MKNIEEQIKQKTEQLEKLGKEVAQLQQLLREKQVEAIRLDSSISTLKELQKELSEEDKKQNKPKEPVLPI